MRPSSASRAQHGPGLALAKARCLRPECFRGTGRPILIETPSLEHRPSTRRGSVASGARLPDGQEWQENGNDSARVSVSPRLPLTAFPSNHLTFSNQYKIPSFKILGFKIPSAIISNRHTFQSKVLVNHSKQTTACQSNRHKFEGRAPGSPVRRAREISRPSSLVVMRMQCRSLLRLLRNLGRSIFWKLRGVLFPSLQSKRFP